MMTLKLKLNLIKKEDLRKVKKGMKNNLMDAKNS
jgi:hypothetical protein